MIKLSEEEMKDEGRRSRGENRRFEILNKEEGDYDKTSLGSGVMPPTRHRVSSEGFFFSFFFFTYNL